jgi:copper homeostasis protein
MSPASKAVQLEICVYSIESALEAQAGGADRIELCDNPPQGGTTPSYGAILTARRALKCGLHVIVRPRGGDFLYSESEFDVMKNDIDACKTLGVHGVVIGLLLPDGRVDVPRTRELVQRAKPMSVTFHRAFDMTADPQQALEDVIDTGCARVLTSGQQPSAMEGRELIAKLVQQAGTRIIVMPGVAIREHNIAQLIRETGAREFHTAASKTLESGMTYRNPRLSMGDGSFVEEYQITIADREQVRRMRQAADAALAENDAKRAAPWNDSDPAPRPEQ